MLGYSQQAAAAAVAASAAAGRLVNPSSMEESNPSPSVLGASATDTGGDHSTRSFSLKPNSYHLFLEKSLRKFCQKILV